jgi:hypothetical protein
MVSEVFFFCAWIQEFVKTASKMNEVPMRHWSLPELVSIGRFLSKRTVRATQKKHLPSGDSGYVVFPFVLHKYHIS